MKNHRVAIGWSIIVIIFLVIYMMMPGLFEGFKEDDTAVREALEHRCGVGLPRCQGELRCINGFCKSDRAPRMPHLSDLPLAP